MKKISFIIQGPTNRTINSKYKDIFLSFFKSLKDYGEVILSTYKNEPVKEFEDIVDNIVLTRPFNRHKVELDSWKNIYNQYETCLNGCLLANGDYCIKFRTDEYYSNIEHIISKLEEDKFVCSNIHYAMPIAAIVQDYEKIRCSDHFFGANTVLFREICEESLYSIGNNKERLSLINSYISQINNFDNSQKQAILFAQEMNSLKSPEGVLLKSLIKTQNISYEEINYFSLLDKYISIIDIKSCRPYIWSMGGKYYTNLESFKILSDEYNLEQCSDNLLDDKKLYSQWVNYDFIDRYSK